MTNNIRNIKITVAGEENMVYVDYEYKAKNGRWVKEYEMMTEEEAREFVEELEEEEA